MTSRTGRPRGAAGLSFAVAALLAATGCSPGDSVAPGAGGQGDRPAAAATTWHALVRGLADADSEAVAGLAAPGDGQARAQLAMLANNAVLLDLVDVSGRYVGRVGPVATDGAWTAEVELSWRLGSLDGGATREAVLVRFVPVQDRVAIRGVLVRPRDGRATPLWVQEEVTVLRGTGWVGVTGATTRTTRDLGADVSHARQRVGRMLGTPLPDVLVELPATDAAYAEVLDAQDSIAGSAAVTIRGSRADGSVDTSRIVVRPGAAGGPGTRARRALLAHEMVHVAAGDESGRMAPWLAEGFAELVSRGAGEQVSDQVALARTLAEAGRHGLPTVLPSEGDFAGRSERAEVAYETAWLACRILAEQVGTTSVVTLWNRVGDGADLAEELAILGVPEADLVRRVRERLQQLA